MVGVIPETVGHFTGITTSGDGGPERIFDSVRLWQPLWWGDRWYCKGLAITISWPCKEGVRRI